MYQIQQQLSPEYSSQQQQQSAPKKKVESKLNQFLSDCLSMGCLRGFKYFELYLRGKEELLCRVYQHNSSHGSQDILAAPASGGNKSLYLPQRLQKVLFDSSSKMAPASPCDRELEKDESKIAYLVAGYARYDRPFVWLRSNHAKLVKMSTYDQSQRDNPVKLDSVDKWPTGDVKVWEILEEVLRKTWTTDKSNPFAVDHDYLNNLPVQRSVILSFALINFLRKVISRNPVYTDEIVSDILKLQERSIIEMAELLKQGSILADEGVVM